MCPSGGSYELRPMPFDPSQSALNSTDRSVEHGQRPFRPPGRSGERREWHIDTSETSLSLHPRTFASSDWAIVSTHRRGDETHCRFFVDERTALR
jgi:hypothetical protein